MRFLIRDTIAAIAISVCVIVLFRDGCQSCNFKTPVELCAFSCSPRQMASFTQDEWGKAVCSCSKENSSEAPH